MNYREFRLFKLVQISDINIMTIHKMLILKILQLNKYYHL